MVNRIWFSLFGKGLVDPVDDLRDSNPAANPELLDALARDFIAHGFDLRHTVREIMNSRTYQLSSRPNATNAADERFFSRALPQRLPAEVLLDTISEVTGSPESFKGFPDATRAVQVPAMRDKSAFLKLFGQPPHETVCECERSSETTLGQSFALISGASLNAKLQRPENRLGKLLAAGRTNDEVVTELYLAALCREPSAKEGSQSLAYLARHADRRAALEDLLWAILNSKEFLLRR
jgi:hypothetical protein